MKAYRNITGTLASVISGLLLVSCTADYLIEESGRNVAGEYTDQICFGIPSDWGNYGTKSAPTAPAEKSVGTLVLRSSDSPDTLCVRTTVTDGIDASSFTGNTPVTRSAPVTSITKGFHVQAHCQDNGTLLSQFYMDTDVTNQSGNIWSSDTPYYWPGAGRTLQFYAWTPSNAFTSVPQTSESTTLSYTVPQDVANQHDLLVAVTNEINGDSNSEVALQFNHICTAVRFEVGSQMQPGTIKSVSLKGVYSEGIYDMTVVDGTGTTDKWKYVDNNGDNKYINDFSQNLDMTTGSEVDGTPITEDAQTFMMLPQTLPPGATVEVVFTDGVTDKERTLSASIVGSEWPQGQTVTYKLSISPEYELDFVTEPTLQDAHYVIYPITIRANDVPGGSWTLTSPDPNVTLNASLPMFGARGYWVEEEKGTQIITSDASGDNITVYAYLAENATDAMREVTLNLRPVSQPSATPATFTISQHYPSWNGDLGCERIEEYDEGYTGYPWGFKWDTDMRITYDAEDIGFFSRIILFFYLGLFNNDEFVKHDISIIPYYDHVIIDFSKISPLDVATDMNNGNQNTYELYNFDGINDASAIMQMLEEWGMHPDKELPTNPTVFAARVCALKNKFNKEVTSEQGQQVERAILRQENLVWYLPASNEAPNMKIDASDSDSTPLTGTYWTSTAINDNENAYSYTIGGVTSSSDRNTIYKVRAVRRR